MRLSELTAYAEEKLHIREQHKWIDFPGFSVLTAPDTDKWIAVLMRQWDFESGQEIERCDIKCGQEALTDTRAPYLSQPFRMKGKQWVGVRFDDSTEAETVCRLLERAARNEGRQGFTIVLEDRPARLSSPYADTPLLFTGAALEAADPEAPDRILEMRRLYEYGDGSFLQKNKNFYRQGSFMADYTDDAPWTGEYRRYFPTYHDLNLRQLRGYFTWRAWVRAGDYRPAAEAFAYIYLYELLCGIGTSSPEDSLQKLRAFEKGYLDAGFGDDGMRKNLRRWMLEYAVLHGLPAETAREYADPALLEQDHALSALKNPQEHTDGTLFDALCVFGGEKLRQSPVVTGDGAAGKRLFAALWRTAAEQYGGGGGQLFRDCFGERTSYPWRPLANAVYWDEERHAPASYVLDACRSYTCRGGLWQENRYDPLHFDRERFLALLHEGDRRFRKYLKIGHYLRERPGEAWAAPYAEAVIRAAEAEAREAARPKITIDLSGLEQIRRDAVYTRDSLLTEEELAEAAGEEFKIAPAGESRTEQAADPAPAFDGLDTPHLRILQALLRGESAREIIKSSRLMPAVAADTINEAFFDEIGDSVLECDGDTVTLIEDYRPELARILGGTDI